MRKRQRDILTALAPAYQFAMQRATGPADKLPTLDAALAKPGIAFTPRAEGGVPAEVMIYGRIGGGGWFDEGISAADVATILREAGPGPLNVRINSGGGDVFDGVAIHSLLARHPGTVSVYVDGLAASAASFIMLAGDQITAARNSFVMIHDAMTYTYGNGDTHRAAGELLDKVSDNIADMYSERAGEDPAYWRGKMTENGEDGVWYTGQEALDAGLVDEITVMSKGEDDEDADLNDSVPGSSAYAARVMSAWRDIMPASIAATINFPAEPAEEEQEEQGDISDEEMAKMGQDFMNIMKGVLA